MPNACLVLLSGSSWAALDGSSGAPSGTAQYPTLLDSYGTVPAWSVAGVDYKVGIATGASLTDWRTLSGTGITVNTTSNYVRLDNRSGYTFSNIDFTLGNGAYLFMVNSPNTTVSGCRFGGSRLSTIPNAVIASDASSGGLTVEYCEMDGDGTGSGSTLIACADSGTFTLRYNYFYNFPQHVVEFTQAAGKTFSVVMKYNLIYNGAMEAGAHLNWTQFSSGNCTSAQVEFNTAYQSEQVASGEGYQFYDNAVGGYVHGVAMNYNVMIADDVTPGDAMSYMVHAGDDVTYPTANDGSVAHDNYMVLTGAFGPWYAGTFTDWTLSNNYNMVTGAALSTNP